MLQFRRDYSRKFVPNRADHILSTSHGPALAPSARSTAEPIHVHARRHEHGQELTRPSSRLGTGGPTTVSR